MKILGEKSLTSKVKVGLIILFFIISIIDISVIGLMIKTMKNIIQQNDVQTNIFNFILFTIIIITGIIALFIINNFIKIFENLKNNELFSEKNSKRLNIISNNCFILSGFYLIIGIFTILTANNYLTKDLINYIFIFSIILMIIFIVSGIGIKILNEIYKKAIEFKEENDFTI